MGKINLKLTPEQVNVLGKAYKRNDYSEFNRKFGEITGKLTVSELVHKMDEVTAAIKNDKDVINTDVETFGHGVESSATNLMGVAEADNKNLKYFNKHQSYNFPKFVNAASRMKDNFILLRRMSYMLNQGNTLIVEKSENYYKLDEKTMFFSNHEEVANYILSVFNLSINFKPPQGEERQR